jgi:hypothetical protein
MSRRIVALFPDGREQDLASLPSLKRLQEIVGGWVESVTILDRIVDGRPVYTLMFVNEHGLLKRLPRNEKATVAYQRNVRWRYAGAENPFRRAQEDFRRQLPAGAFIHDATPDHAREAGYRDDPWIAGPAVLFEGWTIAEVDAAMNNAVGDEA